jgi:predicted ferric reductase
MSGSLAWYLARSSGIVAVLLLGAAVVWGLLLSTRFFDRRPAPRWLLDLHRMLGGLAVVFVGLHLAGLVADNYVHFGVADLLVPFASHWRPAAVALGVVALWILIAVEVTSLAMRHLPRRAWRAVHLSSHVLFWLAVLHGAAAGTDVTNRAYRAFVVTAVAAACFLLVYRLLAGRPGFSRAHRPSARAGRPPAR